MILEKQTAKMSELFLRGKQKKAKKEMKNDVIELWL